jgi:hypothetical protein
MKNGGKRKQQGFFVSTEEEIRAQAVFSVSRLLARSGSAGVEDHRERSDL